MLTEDYSPLQLRIGFFGHGEYVGFQVAHRLAPVGPYRVIAVDG